jgi:hypothetical protein
MCLDHLGYRGFLKVKIKEPVGERGFEPLASSV